MPEYKSKELWVKLPHLDANFNPVKVAYLESGEGCPLILLHGFLGQGASWLPVIDSLETQFRCVSIDLMGFGNSSKPMIRYDVALEVAFLRAIVEALQLKRYAILGHSFGGWVATAYALEYGAEVSHLILAAAAGIRDDEFCGRYNHLRPLLWPIPIVDWGLWACKAITRLQGENPGLDQLIWIRQQLQSEPAARSFLVDRIRPEDAIDTVEEKLGKVQVPTLVITGDRDETIPLWHSQTYAERIPNAELVILPNAGHSLPQDHGMDLAKQVQRFCDRSHKVS